MDPLNCYICDNVSMLYCKNIFKLLSKHSETPINDFIVRFLGKETTRFCDEENVVCCECLTKIDEYDLACLTVERVEREFRATLLQTEAAYATDPVFIEILDRELLEEDELPNDNSGKLQLVKIEFATNESNQRTNEVNDVKEATINVNKSKSNAPKKMMAKKKVINDDKAKRTTSSNNDDLSCPLCTEKFTDRIEFKQHLESHMKNGLFPCDVCNLTTKTTAGMRRHKESHLYGDTNKCTICHKVFKKKNSVARHMRIHVS